MECKHKYVYGGVKYEVQHWNLPGSGAHEIDYYDWFYCEKCLENRYVELKSKSNTYEKILFEASSK